MPTHDEPLDIEAWLRDLGFERYAETFRENEIDAAVLAELTADDLKELLMHFVPAQPTCCR